ncbi:hypothetical protein LP420_33745 [Massilia sp. B-10]|nr:hypothetical protein LP420_33745 [Massilia sp. B-10]
MRQHQKIGLFQQRDRHHLQLRRQRPGHERCRLAVEYGCACQAAGQQLARHAGDGVLAFIDLHVLGAQHVAHRITELKTDLAIGVEKVRAVPVDGIALLRIRK